MRAHGVVLDQPLVDDVLNLRGSWEVGRLLLRVGVENLLNQAYRTHGSGIDGVGRAAWVSVAAGF